MCKKETCVSYIWGLHSFPAKFDTEFVNIRGIADGAVKDTFIDSSVRIFFITETKSRRIFTAGIISTSLYESQV